AAAVDVGLVAVLHAVAAGAGIAVTVTLTITITITVAVPVTIAVAHGLVGSGGLVVIDQPRIGSQTGRRERQQDRSEQARSELRSHDKPARTLTGRALVGQPVSLNGAGDLATLGTWSGPRGRARHRCWPAA